MDNLTIATRPFEKTGMDFYRLKEIGVESLQRLAGQTWTDHNLHDPGITILEGLCYAITDLSYRLSFPIEDLIAPSSPVSAQPYWAKHDALACNPVTEDDYRQLLLSLPEVKGVTVKPASTISGGPQTHGLFDIVIEPQDGISDEASMIDKVKRLFVGHRNLGDDLNKVQVAWPQNLVCKVALSLNSDADVEGTIAATLAALTKFVDSEIHERNVQSHVQIYVSDLIKVVEAIKGIEAFEILGVAQRRAGIGLAKVASEQNQQQQNMLRVAEHQAQLDFESWVLVLEQLTQPSYVRFDYQAMLATDMVEVSQAGHSLTFDSEAVAKKVYTLLAPVTSEASSEQRFTGRYRNLNDYTPVQHELPSIYGVGQERLALQGDTTRQAEILQLKGYLTLFDQVLANLFAQLENIKHLFAIPHSAKWRNISKVFDDMFASRTLTRTQVGDFWDAVAVLQKTHLTQPLTTVSELDTLLGDAFRCYMRDGFSGLTEAPFSDAMLTRSINGMRHLLARFGESPVDASILKYKEVLSHYQSVLTQHSHAPKNATVLISRLVKLKTLQTLASSLAHLPSICGNRGQGMDYLGKPIWGACSAPGYKVRLCHQIGLTTYSERLLTRHNREGFHIVESVMLRPVAAKADTAKVYIVLPDWPTRFANEDFRRLFEQLVLRETPLHLMPELIWLTREQMNKFEEIYTAWRYEWKKSATLGLTEHLLKPEPQLSLQHLNELSQALVSFFDIYFNGADKQDLLKLSVQPTVQQRVAGQGLVLGVQQSHQLEQETRLGDASTNSFVLSVTQPHSISTK